MRRVNDEVLAGVCQAIRATLHLPFPPTLKTLREAAADLPLLATARGSE